MARRAISAVGKHWSNGQKLEAVQTYLILGSIKTVAISLGIPEQTIWLWRRSEWWKDTETELRASENIVLSARMKTIVEKTLGVVEDRLENGDFVWDQKGQTLVRKPVPMKDAAKVLSDLSDRRQKLVTTEQHTVAEEGVKEKLEKLAKSFEDFAHAQKEKTIQVTDVMFVKEE